MADRGPIYTWLRVRYTRNAPTPFWVVARTDSAAVPPFPVQRTRDPDPETTNSVTPWLPESQEIVEFGADIPS